MKFLSLRDLRNQPGFLLELAQREDLVLTVNGKPIAVFLGVEEGNLEETVGAVRQARAQRALSRMRRQAAKRRLEKKLPSAIDAAIRAVRSKRKRV
jgi:prevent-host-death family protein